MTNNSYTYYFHMKDQLILEIYNYFYFDRGKLAIGWDPVQIKEKIYEIIGSSKKLSGKI